MMKVRALAILLALAASACDRAPTGAIPPPEPPPPPVVPADSSVAVVRIVEDASYGTDFTLRVSEPTIAVAVLLDAKGDTIRGESVVWSTSDSSVVRLEGGDGAVFTYLRGRGFGSAVVIATARGVRDSVAVRVIPSPLAVYPYRFGEEVDSLRTLRGTSIRPHVYVDSLHGLVRMDSSELVWSSSDPKVASIDADGRVRSLEPGRTEIRVRRGEHQERAFAVTVEAVRYQAVATGEYHGCGLTADGEVACWGSPRFGQTGVAARGCGGGIPCSPLIDGHDPLLIQTTDRFSSLTATGVHTCGLTEEGVAYCWGLGEATGSYRSLCMPSRTSCAPTPARVPDAPVFRSIHAGGQAFNPTTCGVTPEGEAYCWGGDFDPNGRLGRGSTTITGLAPAPVVGSTRFSTLGVGLFHTCGLDPDGRAHCWGGNYAGQIGTGEADTLAHPVPAPVSTHLRFVAIDAGGSQSCGLTAEGAVYCWGLWGDLVSGRSSPTRVLGGPRFTGLSVGLSHVCALTASGQAYCRGDNGSGQLGGGSIGDDTDRFRAVDTELRFTSIQAGLLSTCGVTTDRVAYCWGEVPRHGRSPLPLKIAGQP